MGSETSIGTTPAGDSDTCAPRKGGTSGAVQPHSAVVAVFGLELLASNGNIAVGKLGENGRAVDWTDENLTIGAVGDLNLGGKVQKVYTAISEIPQAETLSAKNSKL